jgi:hypothetical protein
MMSLPAEFLSTSKLDELSDALAWISKGPVWLVIPLNSGTS